MINIIEELHEQLQKNRTNLSKYYDYYKGKHNIQDPKWETRSNVPEIHNFCKLFIDNNTGFLLGNNVQLKYKAGNVTEDTLVTAHNEFVGHKIQQMNQKLLRDTQIFGYAYELNYINKDGAFDIAIKTPLDLAVKRDGNKVLYGLMEIGRSKDKDPIYNFFDVRGNEIRTVLRVNKNNYRDLVAPKNNIIDNPIIVVYNNWEKQSEMADIMTLNDAYNQVSSDASSEINDFRHAYMHFENAIVDENVLRQMNESGIIVTGKDTKISFVTKDINSDFIKYKLEQLETQIYNQAGQVNFNDTNIGSNTSSLALRNKLTNLINKLKLKEGFLREGMMIRLKNLKDFLVVYSDINEEDELYDPTKVDITFLMNIPTSDKETAEMVIDLHQAGLLSMESAISQLSFINIPKDEIDKILDDRGIDPNVAQFKELLSAKNLEEDDDNEKVE